MADVLVLCYHAVSPSWNAPLSVTPDRLEHQLESLVGAGYESATFTEAVRHPPARRTLAITFDDAFRSVLDIAFPVLERLGLTATVFVPTGFAGSGSPMMWPGIDHWLGGPHESELCPLDWQGLATLAAAGWEIGSHSVSHPKLTGLSNASLAAELVDSKAACEAATGMPCESIAYPYGDVDGRVVAAAAQAGYSAGAALPTALHRPRTLEWPRIGIYHADAAWRSRLKCSRGMRSVRSLPVVERAGARARSL
jgi:peptidoglycan/xylan/chitin deacetylase (PgdA/CDA1 family)